MRARRLVPTAFALLASGAGGVACADEVFAEVPAILQETLAEVRGGFELPEHLLASFKIERIAEINGVRVAHLVVEIPDIANMTVEQANALAAATDTLVIQNGPDNNFQLTDLGPAATVIQNTLNDQHLVALTTISVQVNSLGAFQEMNFHDGLLQGLSAIAGVR
jgi:hypothetical protein